MLSTFIRKSAVVLLAMAVISPPVLAGERGYGHHNRGHAYRHHDYYRHHDHYRQRGHGHKRHKSGNEAAYLLGGIVVGSVLTHVLTAPRSYAAPSPEVHYAPVARPTPVSGRRLFRDIDGNCFERHMDGRGREVLSALPAWECDW